MLQQRGLSLQCDVLIGHVCCGVANLAVSKGANAVLPRTCRDALNYSSLTHAFINQSLGVLQSSHAAA